MNGRLYRLTPAGGKPNHYTDSYASALAKLGARTNVLTRLRVGECIRLHDTPIKVVERVA